MAPSLLTSPPQGPAVAQQRRQPLELECVKEVDEAQDLLSPLPEERQPKLRWSSFSGTFPHPAARSVDGAPTAAAAEERDRLARERGRRREEAVADLHRPPGDLVRGEHPSESASRLISEMRRKLNNATSISPIFGRSFRHFQVLRVMSTVDDWTFDVFELAAVTNGRPLSTLAFALIKRSGISKRLRLDESRLTR